MHLRRRLFVVVSLVVVVCAACTGATGGGAIASSTSSSATSTPPSPAATGTILFNMSRPHDRHATFTMHADGTGVRMLHTPSCCPFVAPDGRVLVDLTPAGASWDVLMLPLAGGPSRTLPNPRPGFTLGPGPISSTGMVAFDAADNSSDETGVWAYRAKDGDGLTQLTDGGDGTHDLPIAWSPNGGALVFARLRTKSFDGPADLYVVRADGTHLARLNPPGTASESLDSPIVGPASWSPDGKHIAFVAAPGGWHSETHAVYVADADGRHAATVATPGNTYNLRWSPDGEWIAYDASDPRDIYLVHPDGSDEHAITSSDDGYWSFAPVWSPDGQHLVFMRSKADFDTSTLWVVGVDGSGLTKLTARPNGYSSYAWTER